MGNPARIARRLANGPGYVPESLDYVPESLNSAPAPPVTALLVKIRSAIRSGYTARAIAYEFGDQIDALLGGPDEAGPLSQSSAE